jgi:hypothetical protein
MFYYSLLLQIHMEHSELADRESAAREKLTSEMGVLPRAVGVFPGTGWRDGLEGVFTQEASVPYHELGVPGIKADAGEVDGHSKNIRKGTIDGEEVLVMGRVHANETKDPNGPLGTRVVMGAVKDVLDGVIVTHGVGSLSGRIGREQGLIKSLARTALIDIMGWAHRGRGITATNPGDLAVVESIANRFFGTGTPLIGGEFCDPDNGALRREAGRYLAIADAALVEAQGKAPRVVYGYVAGPQFESLGDKLALRSTGCDVVGMSGHEVSLAAQWDIPVSQVVLITNGPFAAHSHDGNQAVGRSSADKAGAALQHMVTHWPRS